MSRKPVKKTNPADPEGESVESFAEEIVDESNAQSDLDNPGPLMSRTVSQQNEEPLDPDDFGEEEFSLDQLSQAYAEVLKQSQPHGDASETELKQDSADLQLDDEISLDPVEDGETDDDEPCPISPESIIESILFVGAPKDVVLNSRKMAAVLRDVSPKEVTKIVRELNAKYEQEDAAYRIESDGGVFKMVLDPKLIEFQQHFYGRDRQVRLTQAAIDVMAIVAYNQPITRRTGRENPRQAQRQRFIATRSTSSY